MTEIKRNAEIKDECGEHGNGEEWVYFYICLLNFINTFFNSFSFKILYSFKKGICHLSYVSPERGDLQ